MEITCTRCGRSLPESMFYVLATGRRLSECKDCGAERAREYRANGGAQVQIHATRTFGVEIEFYAPVADYVIAQAITAAGVNCRNEAYNHTTKSWWKVVTDGSLNEPPAGMSGWELVSPPLAGKAGLKALKTALEVLDRLGCKVNKTCGIHVHHDARDLDLGSWKRVLTTYARFESTIDSFHPASRRQNNAYYARSMATQGYDHLTLAEAIRNIEDARRRETLQSLWRTRYMKVNTQAFVKHGTLEFRQHAGSINFDKISNWVMLTQLLMVSAKAARPVTSDLWTTIGAKAKIARFFEARATALAA